MPYTDKNPVFDRAKQIAASLVTQTIRERGLKQHEAALLVGDAPSQISLVVTGTLYAFSFDRLVRWLLKLGWNVRIEISRAPSARGRLSVNVHKTTNMGGGDGSAGVGRRTGRGTTG